MVTRLYNEPLLAVENGEVLGWRDLESVENDLPQLRRP